MSCKECKFAGRLAEKAIDAIWNWNREIEEQQIEEAQRKLEQVEAEQDDKPSKLSIVKRWLRSAMLQEGGQP